MDGGAVGAIGLTGQMHGAVLLDAADRPVRPAILWNRLGGRSCSISRRATGPARSLRRSTLWRQILADVLDVELVGTGTTEGAASARRSWPHRRRACSRRSATPVAAAVSVTPMAEPGPDRATYVERHALHRALYLSLAPLFPRM